MKTRNQTRENLKKYDFVFDFDESSRAWKENKKSAGNATYTYVCQNKTIQGIPCSRKCLSNEDYCKTHLLHKK